MSEPIKFEDIKAVLTYGGHNEGYVCTENTEYLIMAYRDPDSPFKPVIKEEAYHYNIFMFPDGRRYPVFVHESKDVHTMTDKEKNVLSAHLTLFYEEGLNTLEDS